MSQDDFLTVAEIAAELRVDPVTVQKLCREGMLQSYWVGSGSRKANTCGASVCSKGAGLLSIPPGKGTPRLNSARPSQETRPAIYWFSNSIHSRCSRQRFMTWIPCAARRLTHSVSECRESASEACSSTTRNSGSKPAAWIAAITCLYL